MLKIMIELSSTYEYFQRAHTHTHLRTHARAYRTTHQMQTCAAFMHNAQTCKELSVSRHDLRNSSENAFKWKMIPVAHLRWLRWCPSGFSAHYITDFWFGREDSPNVLVHPPVILIQSYVVLLFPKTAGKCMMICLEELWRLFIVTSDKPNHDNPTHILSEWNEREYEPESMSFCACEYALDVNIGYASDLMHQYAWISLFDPFYAKPLYSFSSGEQVCVHA